MDFRSALFLEKEDNFLKFCLTDFPKICIVQTVIYITAQLRVRQQSVVFNETARRKKR
jgi:hypothetical protein